MAKRELANGITLIDDSYNANPQSMQAALESLARLKGAGRSLAVLGDMAELGSETRTFHERVGRNAAELEIDFLFAVGQHATSVADGARRAGMDPGRIHVAAESTEIGAIVREILRPRDWILVKGSRAMKMERVVDALAQEGS
jgi:UDP-N-acetylmuramoyl-tripeptide--D-alanyl-D-alanine ligase